MKLITIFEDKLFAFKFDGEQTDEFERAFDLWADNEYLEYFFEENIKDLTNGFYDVKSTDDAVMITLTESYEFQEIILKAAKKNDLDRLFKNLDNKEFRHVDLGKKKAYGTEYKSWLRIYALQIENAFLITGSAIKLTASMNEREHTNNELIKIEQCKSFLKENGIWDTQGLKEMEL